MRFSILCLIAVLAFAGIGQAESPAPRSLLDTGADSFVYKTVGDRSLRIDWTKPPQWKGSDVRGAVVFFHGGGWTGGKPDQFASHCDELAKLGVVSFRVEYRLIPAKSKGGPENCVADASDAFRFVRGHASELGIDPTRVAAGGGSAGGHLAAYLGMMDDEIVAGISRKPDALLLFNPVYSNGPGEWGHERVGDRYTDYSPAHNITADDPPAIVFLGTADNLIPVATAERFRDTMKAAGVRSELHLYTDQPHGFFNAKAQSDKYYRITTDTAIGFLKELGWL